MNLPVNLQLSSEHVAMLRQMAADSGLDLDAYVSQMIVEHLNAQPWPTRRTHGPRSDFGEWFQAWAAKHPQLSHVIDDSRESIYEGCGE